MKGLSKQEMQAAKAAKKLLNAPKGRTKKDEKKRQDEFINQSLKALGLWTSQ